MNTIACETNIKNTPYKQFCDVNLSAFRKIIVAPVGDYFGTATEGSGVALASTYAAWRSKIMKDKGFRIYPIKPAFNVKPENQDDTFADTAFEGMKFIRLGKESFTLEIEASPYVQERLWALNRTSGSCYIADANENILGWSDDGGKFRAFTMEMFNVKKMTQSDGSTPRTIEIKVVLSNPNEWNGTPQVAVPEAGFTPTELEGLYDLKLTRTEGQTNSATKIYVTTEIIGTGKGMTGLTLATDWTVTAGTISSVAETASGVYTITGTSFVTASTLRTQTPSVVDLSYPTSVIKTVLPCETLIPLTVVI